MGHNQLFNLDERLMLCATFVRENTALTDVGTDHAYLPVWLAKKGKIRSAVASDVRTGPLKNAEENIKKYGVNDMVTTCLSNGLRNVMPEMAEDIVMAGMGGELIAAIIQETQWLCDGSRRLILQPMTHAELLRIFLYENGFDIAEEKACISGKKVYSVMLCVYDGIKRECTDLFKFIGKLENDNSQAAYMYKQKIAGQLRKKLLGLPKQSDEAIALKKVLAVLPKEVEDYDNGIPNL